MIKKDEGRTPRPADAQSDDNYYERITRVLCPGKHCINYTQGDNYLAAYLIKNYNEKYAASFIDQHRNALYLCARVLLRHMVVLRESMMLSIPDDDPKYLETEMLFSSIQWSCLTFLVKQPKSGYDYTFERSVWTEQLIRAFNDDRAGTGTPVLQVFDAFVKEATPRWALPSFPSTYERVTPSCDLPPDGDGVFQAGDVLYTCDTQRQPDLSPPSVESAAAVTP